MSSISLLLNAHHLLHPLWESRSLLKDEIISTANQDTVELIMKGFFHYYCSDD